MRHTQKRRPRPYRTGLAEVHRKAAIYNDRTIRPKRSAVIGHRRRFLWEIVHQVGRAFAWIRGR